MTRSFAVTSAMLFAGVALAALGTPHIAWRATPPSGLDAADPLALAQAVCGRSGKPSLAARRTLFVSAATAYAAAAAPAAAPAGPPPIIEGLGASRIAITTANPEADAYFQQGLRIMHGFNHGEARKSFVHAQSLDPTCAMCFWGEAVTLGPNINAPMDPEDNPRAHEAAQAAKKLAAAPGVSDKERALIEALALRYAKTAPEDRSKLDTAYADAMAKVAERFADDDEIAGLAAEAMMDTQPWSYWEPDGRTPKGRTAAILALLERVIARNPRHAPSIHLYIHMTEASNDPWRAEAHADRLAGLAPNSGHLVHMPAHTYIRIGRYKDSIAANKDAVEADEAYIAAATASPIYRYGYYPHNIHFVMTSAQSGGDGETALSMADKLDAALPNEMAATLPWVQPIKGAPWLARAQYAEPDAILAAPQPAGAPPYVLAHWRYARGEALAQLGRGADARAEAKEIEAILAGADLSALEAGGVPARAVLSLMLLMIEGRLEMAAGDYKKAAAAFDKAVALQRTLPYFEPPHWHYPIRRTLAAALLLDGQAGRARQEFLAALVDSPDDGFAYWGLAQAYGAEGDRTARKHALGLYKRAWLGARKGPDIGRM